MRPSEPRSNEMIEPAKAGPGLAGLTWVIRPSLIPPGDTMRLSVQPDPDFADPGGRSGDGSVPRAGTEVLAAGHFLPG